MGGNNTHVTTEHLNVKNSYKRRGKNANYPMEKWAKDIFRYFLKPRRLVSMWGKQSHESSGKGSLETQEDIRTHPLGCLKLLKTRQVWTRS